MASCQKLGIILVINGFKNWFYQKMSITTNVLLNWYSSMKTSLKSQKFTWPLACVYISFVKLKDICSCFFPVLFKNLKDTFMILRVLFKILNVLLHLKKVHILLHLKNIYSRFFKIFHVLFRILNDVLLHSV